MEANNETNITEIELCSDGRIFIFGASYEVLRLLDDLALSDDALRSRLETMRDRRQYVKDASTARNNAKPITEPRSD